MQESGVVVFLKMSYIDCLINNEKGMQLVSSRKLPNFSGTTERSYGDPKMSMQFMVL